MINKFIINGMYLSFCYFMSYQKPPMSTQCGFFPSVVWRYSNKFSRCRKLALSWETSYICLFISGVVGRLVRGCQAFWNVWPSVCMLFWHPYICQYVHMSGGYICLYAQYICTPSYFQGTSREDVCLSGISVSVSTSICLQVYLMLVRSYIVLGLSNQLIYIIVGHMQCHVWLAWVPSVFWAMF